MTNLLLYPEQIDRLLTWPLGTAARLSRQRRLPDVRLPDGATRFVWDEVEALVLHVPTAPDRETAVSHV